MSCYRKPNGRWTYPGAGEKDWKSEKEAMVAQAASRRNINLIKELVNVPREN